MRHHAGAARIPGIKADEQYFTALVGVCPIGTSMDSPNIDPNKKNPNHFKRTVSREFWDYNYMAHLATLIF